MDRSTAPPMLLARVDALIAWATASFPEVTIEEPWGFPLIKVRGKILCMVDIEDGKLRFTSKLRDSNAEALDRPNVEPASHGLGKSGWITATIDPLWPIDDEQLHAWAEESFTLIAPKKLVQQRAALKT